MKTTCLNLEHFYDLPCHVYCKDQKGIYLESNDYHYLMSGGDRGRDYIGFSDLDICTQQIATSIQKNDLRVITNNTSLTISENVRFKKHDDAKKEFTTLSFKQPFYNKRNKLIGILGLSFIITQHSADRHPFAQLTQTIQSPLTQKLKELQAEINLVPEKSLTTRQADCLYYLVKGYTAKQIGTTLSLSHRTIEHHIDTLKHKYQCASRSELITKALTMDCIRYRLQTR